MEFFLHREVKESDLQGGRLMCRLSPIEHMQAERNLGARENADELCHVSCLVARMGWNSIGTQTKQIEPMCHGQWLLLVKKRQGPGQACSCEEAVGVRFRNAPENVCNRGCSCGKVMSRSQF